jgi:hypothetical protein
MRPPRWFKPASDLRPILRLLNGRQDAAATRRLTAEIEKCFREKSLHKRSQPRQWLNQALARQFLRRMEHRRLTRFLICQELTTLAEDHDIGHADIVEAWRGVWHQLRQWRPDIPDRICDCPWCGDLFWTQRARDRFCSAACGRGTQLWRGRETEIGQRIVRELERLDHMRRVSQQRLGHADAEIRESLDTYRKILLSAIFGSVAPNARLEPRNPRAFRTVWAFVFQPVPRVAGRLFQCPHCERVDFQRDARRTFCSDRCRRAAWKQRRHSVRTMALKVRGEPEAIT